MIEVKDLKYSLCGNEILKGINATFNDGEIIGIIGMTGTGKSTFLKLLSGEIKAFEGEILINNMPTRSLTRREIHQNISYLYRHIPENMEETLFDFLLLSRIPYKKFLNPFSDYDIQVVEDNMRLLELNSYRNERLCTLPDSVLKRAVIAFALIRDAAILLLDNPTSDLDIHSISILHKTLSRYVISGSKISIIVSSDLNFILQTTDRVLLLRDGMIELEEDPGNIDIEIIKKYFDTEVFLSKNIYNGRPNIHFFPQN